MPEKPAIYQVHSVQGPIYSNVKMQKQLVIVNIPTGIHGPTCINIDLFCSILIVFRFFSFLLQQVYLMSNAMCYICLVH